ncbi:hypothetical protein CBS101457_002929 [Exobasidium rhododendri]|nr:hypothetical protein CBS101457_002929 [Exobasidium rhododendri]
MAPSVDTPAARQSKTSTVNAPSSAPLRAFSNFDSTPSIGTEFRQVSTDGKEVLSIQKVLKNEDLLGALSRLVSERGVVFFRDAVLSTQDQKDLVDRLGKASGKPATSGLHVHPFTVEDSQHGDEISVVSNDFVFSEKYKRPEDTLRNRPVGHTLWVSAQKSRRSVLDLLPRPYLTS